MASIKTELGRSLARHVLRPKAGEQTKQTRDGELTLHGTSNTRTVGRTRKNGKQEVKRATRLVGQCVRHNLLEDGHESSRPTSGRGAREPGQHESKWHGAARGFGAKCHAHYGGLIGQND